MGKVFVQAREELERTDYKTKVDNFLSLRIDRGRLEAKLATLSGADLLQRIVRVIYRGLVMAICVASADRLEKWCPKQLVFIKTN